MERKKRTGRMDRMRSVLARWAGRGVAWTGLALIGLLIIPTGVLIVLILTVRAVTDKLIGALSARVKDSGKE